jgi:cathepsin D
MLGMGFSSLSPFNTSTVFEKFVKEGQLPEPVFGIALADSNPELIIGGRDSSRYNGDLVYSPVDTGNTVRTARGVPCLHFNTDTIQSFWQIKLDGITINGNGTQVSTKEAVIDTGSTQVLGDQNSIANIYASIPGSAQANASEGEYWTCTFVTELIVGVAN